ncbi:hypothetical protein J2X68_000112 [Streptomyces sp. 3330]|uniref:hypothetical protein n=1 Tax=Streptomyces sp. 3330 TaxID=2817755 RepID=UPI002861BD06|nr:hypothetical protein [Streptomyces sp. 3330]MDR6973443.1 hypothetical protein [Streptomyces sp. 3330]
MTFGDQGPGSPPGQGRIRRRRRTRRSAAVGSCAALVAAVAAVAAGTVLSADEEDGPRTVSAPPATAATASRTVPGPAAVPSGAAGPPSRSASALASLLARPVVRPEQAFPSTGVRLQDGSRYARVDLSTTVDCARGVSPGLARLAGQGAGCSRSTAALFTDTGRRSQVTVTVLSFERVEDAWRVFTTASADPVTYQAYPLDPPAEAGLPTVPQSAAEVSRRAVTVRSVVFATGRRGDADGSGPAELAARTEGLLQRADDTVTAYEEGRN